MESSTHGSRRLISICSSALALVGCGGVGGADATIGGTLSGLTDGLSVVLQDNLASNLTLTANGTFVFATKLLAGDAYNVTVLTQPVGQACTVANATGTVKALNNVSNVTVTCAANASVVGTVTGLAAGTSVTLTNGTIQLAIATNGAFAFPELLSPGTAYSVRVAISPRGQTCTLLNAAGTIPSTGSVTVTVSCK